MLEFSHRLVFIGLRRELGHLDRKLSVDKPAILRNYRHRNMVQFFIYSTRYALNILSV